MGDCARRWLSLVALLVATVTCGGQGTDLAQAVTSGGDGGSGQGNDPPPTPFQDAFAGAPAYSGGQSGGDGSHNAGRACMQQGCHGDAAGGHSEAPAFLIGGTVYQDYAGKTPASGVEVRILDGQGHAASAYSDRGGNFYIRAGNANGVTFPAWVGARDANIERPMIMTLNDPTMGSCAQGGCHVAGGSPMTGAYYPIHVP